MSEPTEVTNLMANPKPISVSAWKAGAGGDISISMSDDGWMQMTNNTKSHDCFVYARIQLPAGAWRYGAEIDAPTGSFASNELRFIHLNPVYEMQNASWDGTSGRIVTPANTLKTEAQVELRLMVGANAGDAVRVRPPARHDRRRLYRDARCRRRMVRRRHLPARKRGGLVS